MMMMMCKMRHEASLTEEREICDFLRKLGQFVGKQIQLHQ